jgi:hypothetical protein
MLSAAMQLTLAFPTSRNHLSEQPYSTAFARRRTGIAPGPQAASTLTGNAWDRFRFAAYINTLAK